MKQTDSVPSSKRALAMGLLAGVAVAVQAGEAAADGLQLGFKKDMRPVRSRGNVDPSLYTDGPQGLKCACLRSTAQAVSVATCSC